MTTLIHQVWIDAPASKVFAALATAEALGRWWAPHTSTITSHGIVLAHSPGPAHGDVQMKVTDCTEPSRIAWEIISSHPSRSPASAWTGTRVVFELSEQPSPGEWLGMTNEGRMMTVVNFRHEGWNERSEFLGFCNYAWGMVLDLLRQDCEKKQDSRA